MKIYLMAGLAIRRIVDPRSFDSNPRILCPLLLQRKRGALGIAPFSPTDLSSGGVHQSRVHQGSVLGGGVLKEHHCRCLGENLHFRHRERGERDLRWEMTKGFLFLLSIYLVLSGFSGLAPRLRRKFWRDFLFLFRWVFGFNVWREPENL